MLERIIISGAGGQGVILLGKLIARVAVAKNMPHVTFFPAYGAEVRGCAAQCEVIMSAHEIASPCAEQADTLILMNRHGAADFMRRLAPGGLALINSSLCRIMPRPDSKLCVVQAPASELADKVGNPRAANMVMLGLLLRRKPFFEVEIVETAIRGVLAESHADLLKINLKAFHAGLDFKIPVP